ncbi:MAG TPA: peptidyl-prolyl cis-trans isomerase [Campylobacterales bacterium]|nr:peptidyl-prolyl cis-trans isomerase [Campylobacterales bacterium]
MKKFLFSVCAAAVLAGSVLAAETVATVNDKSITMDDVNAFLRAIPGASDYASMPKEVKEKVINQLIDNQLLLEEATKEGIQGAEEYKKELDRVSRELALNIWLSKQFDKVAVSDEEAKKFYDANGEKFNQPELFNARHIIVKTEAEASKILKELQATPKAKLEDAFAAAAGKYSIDGTKENGGRLGWLAEGRIVKEFYSAAKTLKKGEMSKKPVKTQFGYHIIFISDYKPAGKVSFEAAKEQIKQQIIKPEKYKDAMISKAKSLREKAKVEIKK